MTLAWGSATDLVLGALRDIGPLTSLQLQDLLGISKGSMSQVLTRLRTGKTGAAELAPKRIYIRRWLSSMPGKKNHLRPEYAIGGLPDAPKPPPKPKWQAQADYRATQQVRARAAMGLPLTPVVRRQSGHELLPSPGPARGLQPAGQAPAEAAAAA